MFACAEEPLGHVVLGHHDGLDSWTVNVAADPAGERQAFVSRHERAHQELHSSTPWGLAMVAAATPDSAGTVGTSAWRRLGLACRRTHEAFATFVAVHDVEGGLEHLRGNLAYLSFLRDAETLADVVGDSGGREVATRMLLMSLMAPSRLAAAGRADLHDAGWVERLCAGHSPDERLRRLLDALAADRGGAQELRRALRPGAGGVIRSADVAAALTALGLPTWDFGQAAQWTRSIVADLVAQGARRFQLVDAGSDGQRLESLVDDQQRERLQVHGEPLPLTVVHPDEGGRFEVAAFARTAAGIGAHVWLCWLAPGFVRRQFATREDFGSEPMLGLLACDRTRSPATATWLPWPGVAPGLAARIIARTQLTPLLFTTLRTLEATGHDVDFRGWDPSVVLLDSDVLAFLERSAEDPAGVAWSVIGASGDRTVDALLFQRLSAPGVVYVYVCSAPTGRTFAGWMRTRPNAFHRDEDAFREVRDVVWAIVEHALGTLWMFDLYGHPAGV